jgi:hypothetical protein
MYIFIYKINVQLEVREVVSIHESNYYCGMIALKGNICWRMKSSILRVWGVKK